MSSLNQSDNIALTAVNSSDSESDGELSQNHKKKKPIESKSTIDTTEPMQLGEFIEMGSKVSYPDSKKTLETGIFEFL